MNMPRDRTDQRRIVPLTTNTWELFEQLLGPDGLQGGCWCTYFRMNARDFERSAPAEHKQLARRIVDQGDPFGLLAVQDEMPMGWVAVAPRQDNPRLGRSAVARVDSAADVARTWSVTCFYIDRRSRHRGLTETLLREAVQHAAANGAGYVEGYPVDAGGGKIGAGSLYHGELQTFLDGGFELIDRRGTRRVLVRRTL